MLLGVPLSNTHAVRGRVGTTRARFTGSELPLGMRAWHLDSNDKPIVSPHAKRCYGPTQVKTNAGIKATRGVAKQWASFL